MEDLSSKTVSKLSRLKPEPGLVRHAPKVAGRATQAVAVAVLKRFLAQVKAMRWQEINMERTRPEFNAKR